MNMPYQQPMMNYTPNYGAYQYNPMASYQRYQQPEPTQGISGRVVQAVAVNGNVLFTDAPTSVCNKGYISHRTGSGLINLKGATNTCKAKYRVEFNGNIAVPTGGTAGAISLAIAVEGEPDLSTLAISTPTAVEAFNNVSMATDVWLPCGCCQAISVKNTSAQAISVANANITVNRIG